MLKYIVYVESLQKIKHRLSERSFYSLSIKRFKPVLLYCYYVFYINIVCYNLKIEILIYSYFLKLFMVTFNLPWFFKINLIQAAVFS